MEMESQQDQEIVPQESQAAPESPQEGLTEAAPEADQGSPEGSPEGASLAPEAPSYQPELKYRMGKVQYDFDPRFKDLIKSKEHEELIRDYHTRAHGLEDYKTQIQGYESALGDMRKAYARKDFESILKTLQIPKNEIVDWVVKLAQYENTPPEERQKIDQMRAAETRAHQLADETENLRANYQDTLQKSFQREMELAMSRSEVKKFGDAFNARAGTPTAFWDEVRREGLIAYEEQKKVLAPQEAIQSVMSRFKWLEPAQEPEKPELSNPSNGREPPVITNLKSGNKASSPTQKRVKSLDDIRKRFRELNN